MKTNIKILFIGNSHTYYNDLPKMVKDLFASTGINAEVSMQTEGGKNLLYHCDRKDVIFNIVYGDYDYVVLQEVSKDFDRNKFYEGVEKLYTNALNRSDTKPVFYMIWARREQKKLEPEIEASYAEIAEKLDAPLAPAGEVWYKFLRRNKSLELFRQDGVHATPIGSYIAASCIFYAITKRERPLRLSAGGEPHTRLELDFNLCRKIQSETCRTAKKYNLK